MVSEEEKLDFCRRALIIKPNSDSYFFSVSASKPKIPKILGKVMQRRNNGCNNNMNHGKGKNKNKWGKFGSFFSAIFSSKKSYSKVQRNGGGGGDHHQTGSSEAEILQRVDQSFGVVHDHDENSSSSSMSYSFKIGLQSDGVKRPNKAEKNYLKVSLSVPRLFNKSPSCYFIRSKKGNRSASSIDAMNLQSDPSTHQNSKVAQSSKIINRGESSETEVTDGGELCKKRILMGEKCKPLNHSGTLRYDNNGILLPDPELIP